MRGRGHHRQGRRGRNRHMLQPTLLLMMHLGAAHGYELMERLKQYGPENIDPSLIYRALHSLEEEGLVTSTWDEEKSQGPPRRVYSLTQAGDGMLAQYMDELKITRERIDRLLETYKRHMRNGQGDFHDSQE